MFRRLVGKLNPSKTPANPEDEDVEQECVEGAKTWHLSCPRCRRLIIVPKMDAFRCPCSLVFRVIGTDDQVQLCFSLRGQDAHAEGSGLPRKLVERMPVVTMTEDMCCSSEEPAGGQSAVCADPDEGNGDSDNNTTCRICLLDYKAADKVRVLPCFHRFHMDEIDSWLNRNTSCPLCHLDVGEALTGCSGMAILSAMEGNPTSVIDRRRRRRR